MCRRPATQGTSPELLARSRARRTGWTDLSLEEVVALGVRCKWSFRGRAWLGDSGWARGCGANGHSFDFCGPSVHWRDLVDHTARFTASRF